MSPGKRGDRETRKVPVRVNQSSGTLLSPSLPPKAEDQPAYQLFLNRAHVGYPNHQHLLPVSHENVQTTLPTPILNTVARLIFLKIASMPQPASFNIPVYSEGKPVLPTVAPLSSFCGLVPSPPSVPRPHPYTFLLMP